MSHHCFHHAGHSDGDALNQRLYGALYRIRRVEEEICRVYPSDKITSPVHLSIGQEAISVAVCEALAEDDVVFGSYRCHAMYLAKGGDLRGMIAELYGKSTGVARGKAGSMHLIDTAAGVMGASAVVATHVPLAVGYALAAQMQGRPTVVACFLGDGAVEEGAFHESLNFAALRRLPILFVCENNAYAIHSRQQDRQAKADICELARAHGVPAERFEDLDVYRLFARSCQVVEELRAGATGPMLLECRCYRWLEHVGPGEDFQAGYRKREEAAPWIAGDPLSAVGAHLSEATRRRLERSIEEEIRDAFEFAELGPFPDAAELHRDLFA